jgi:hypothetical protein
MYHIKHLGPNFLANLVRYSREFVIAVIVITEFDCTSHWFSTARHTLVAVLGLVDRFAGFGTLLAFNVTRSIIVK